MGTIFTRHAKRRMRRRNVSASRVTAAARRGRSRGKGVYRAEVERHGRTIVVIYKKRVGGKKVILSTWKK